MNSKPWRYVMLQAVAFIPLSYGVVLVTRVVLLNHPFAWFGVDQILTPILISLAPIIHAAVDADD
ncbi:MAG: hypothetical protein ACR2G7_00690 [Acidimicrobiales bacterium]